MEAVTLNDIVDAAERVDTKRFIAELDAFIKMSARLAPADAAPPAKRRDAAKRRMEEACANILREGGLILSGSTLSISCIINFHFQLNGQASGLPSRDDMTRSYFRKLRKHQVELLRSIGSEISMIRNALKHSRRMAQVLQENVPPVLQASHFMDILRERIDARPTTLLKLNGRGRKIEQLNSSFSEIQHYENAYHQNIRNDAEANPVTEALAIYNDLSAETVHDMAERRDRLKASTKELEKGRKLMIKLALKGYSPLMKKPLDVLVEKHRRRTRNFEKKIQQWREAYYIEEHP